MSDNSVKSVQPESLRRKAITGTLWSALQKFGIAIISFLSNIVLARLLTPDDYGCIGMLSIFLVISNSLILGGFISALIQKKDATEIDYSTVFLWNIIVSFVLYIILFFSASIIANFYHIYKLGMVLRVQGVVLILNGLGAIQTTLLRKTLQFNKLAKVNIVSSIVSVIVAIAMAYRGYGVWALVFQQICMSLFNTLLLWIVTEWRPILSFSLKSFKELFGYGAYLLLAEIVSSICDNIQGLIIGHKFNAVTMGYYAQAKKLEEVPTASITQVVNQVTFPIYASLQNDKERLKNTVRRTLGLMNFINFPLMLLLIVVAKPLFIFLFSEKWINSVLYFQILCLAGLVCCLQSVNYQVVAAIGKSRILFFWNFIKRGIGLVFMVIGLIWGVEGLLFGMVLSSYFTYIVNAQIAVQATDYTVIQQIKDFFPNLLKAFISAIVAYTPVCYIHHNFTLLVIQSCVFLITYILLSYYTKSKDLYEITEIVKSFIKKKNDRR